MLISSTNALVDEHNKVALSMFPGRLFTLRTATRIELLCSKKRSKTTDELISTEMTYNYALTVVPSHTLELKVGVLVMIIHTVLHTLLVNGNTYIVKRVITRLLLLSTTSGSGPNLATFVLHRIVFQLEFFDIKILRRQFPARLAFSATLHKARGNIVSKLVVELGTNFFAAGQLCATLSCTPRASDVVALHKAAYTPPGAGVIHHMPMSMSNPARRPAA